MGKMFKHFILILATTQRQIGVGGAWLSGWGLGVGGRGG